MKKITLLAAIFAVFAMNAQTSLFSDDFDSETVDATTYTNWTATDVDGDGENWEVFDADGTGNTWIFSGLGADSDSWEGTPFMPDQFLTTTSPIAITGTGATLTYQVGTYQTNGTFLEDRYQIYLTTSNDPAVIVNSTPIRDAQVGDLMTAAAGDGSDSAVEIVEDISAFEGQVVYLTFRHFDTFDHNSVLIDNVDLSVATLSVDDQVFNNFSYLVDANDNLRLTANTSMDNVQLYNVLGQQVVSQKLSSNNESINLSSLQSGVYIATVTIEGQNKSFKIVKR